MTQVATIFDKDWAEADSGVPRGDTGKASAYDREHFRKIGRWKYESHRQSFLDHMALPIQERLELSVGWGIEMHPGWRWSTNGDGAGALHRRARELGLYRG